VVSVFFNRKDAKAQSILLVILPFVIIVAVIASAAEGLQR